MLYDYKKQVPCQRVIVWPLPIEFKVFLYGIWNYNQVGLMVSQDKTGKYYTDLLETS